MSLILKPTHLDFPPTGPVTAGDCAKTVGCGQVGCHPQSGCDPCQADGDHDPWGRMEVQGEVRGEKKSS